MDTNFTDDQAGLGRYEIRLSGELDDRWRAWFDGLTVVRDGDGTTVLTGPLADQAGLHGVLQRIRDLGMVLISVARLDEPHPSTHPTTHRGDSA